MVIVFTKSGAAALWSMVCQPGRHLEQKFWYRAEDPVGEVEMARLHKFCDEVLPIKQGEEEVLDRNTGKTRSVPTREFDANALSLRQDLVDRALEVIKHFRKQAHEGRGGILPGVFAELEASLRRREQPADMPLDDLADVEELKKLQAEMAAAKVANEQPTKE